jgi:hypothetical protein
MQEKKFKKQRWCLSFSKKNKIVIFAEYYKLTL